MGVTAHASLDGHAECSRGHRQTLCHMPGVLDVLSSGELSLSQNVMALDSEYFLPAGIKEQSLMPINGQKSREAWVSGN